MAAPKLTRRDRLLVKEVHALVGDLRLDPDKIAIEMDPELRNVALRHARLHLIRGEVITQFTLVDEVLTHELAIEMLGGRKEKPWKTKKRRFDRVKSVLSESRMSVRQKLDLYRSYRRVPARVTEIIAGLNSARNALAHVFYLEGQKRRAKYLGQDILSTKTFERFQNDLGSLFDYFLQR